MELYERIQMLSEDKEFNLVMTKDKKGNIEVKYYDSKAKEYILNPNEKNVIGKLPKLEKDSKIKYFSQEIADEVEDFTSNNKSKLTVNMLDKNPIALGGNLPLLLKKLGYLGKIKPVKIDNKRWVGEYIWDLGQDMYIQTSKENNDGESMLMFRKDDGNEEKFQFLDSFNTVKEIPRVIKKIKKYYGKSEKGKWTKR